MYREVVKFNLDSLVILCVSIYIQEIINIYIYTQELMGLPPPPCCA